MSKVTAPEPELGQVWMSNDKRDVQFERSIIAMDDTHVTLDGPRPTRVRRDRMRPTSTGYRFVRDGGALSDVSGAQHDRHAS